MVLLVLERGFRGRPAWEKREEQGENALECSVGHLVKVDMQK